MAESYKFGYWGSTTEEILKTNYPLHRACRDGDVETLSLLLVEAQHGIYVEDSFYGWTPAHWAAYFGKLNCLMCLLESGISCDGTTIRLTQTPAHIAAFGGHSHCLKWLLHCGASINKQDYLKETPIHKAARTGSMECASLLVSLNARLNVVNSAGQSPSQLAGACGFQECANFLEAASQRQEELNSGTHHHTPHTVTVSKDESACVIAHGLNGGKLPPPVVHIPNGLDHTECDMEEESDHTDIAQGDLTLAMPFIHNGHAHLTNGHVVPHHRPVPTDHPHGDITVHSGISANQVPVAGCKRTREDTDEIEYKRVRRNDPEHGPPEGCSVNGFHAGDFHHHVRHPPDLFTRELCVPQSVNGVLVSMTNGHSHMDGFNLQPSGHGGGSPLPDSVRNSLLQSVPENVANGVVAYVQDSLTSSAVEHHHSVMLEQGYDSMFCEAMTAPIHYS